MARISDFMVGIILASFVISSFVLFMSDVGTRSGLDYDNDTFNSYNQLNNISSVLNEANNNSESWLLSSIPFLDDVSAFFGDAYKTFLITKKSYTVYEEMTNNVASDLNGGAISTNFKITIQTVVFVVILVGIFLSAFLKYPV